MKCPHCKRLINEEDSFAGKTPEQVREMFYKKAKERGMKLNRKNNNEK